MANTLTVEHLQGGYKRGVDIVHDVSLRVQQNEIIVIAGTNGSGKSTLLRGVIGLLPYVSGEINLFDERIDIKSTEERVLVGMGYVPQVNNVFGALTVQENIQLGNIRGRTTVMDQMLSLFPELKRRLRQKAGSLSGGERQMLAFARALAGGPKVLVLDEPTAALAPGVVKNVLQLIVRLRTTGVAILLVEQRARQALEIGDRGYIMDRGRVVLDGPAPELLGNERMVELYLGTGAHT